MRKLLLYILLTLAMASPAMAQSTLVSATVTDAGGQAWINGTYTFTSEAYPSIAIISGTLDSTGSFTSITFPTNNVTAGVGGRWRVKICPAVTAPCYGVNVSIPGGSTINLTSVLTPPIIAIPALQPQPITAYADAEITGAVQGNRYFNVTDSTEHVCKALPCSSNWVSNPSSGTGTFAKINGICEVDGVTNTTLAAAVTCAGSNGVIDIPPLTIATLTGSVVIPSGVTLHFWGGTPGRINLGGFTLTINGPIQAPEAANIFTGSGTVLVNNLSNSVHALWFQGSDFGAQLQNAMASCPTNCRVWVPDSAQSYSTPLNMAVGAANGVHLIGAGEGATILTYTGVTSSPALSFGCTTNAEVEHLQITTANASGTGVFMCGTNNKLHDVTINGFGSGIPLDINGSGTPSFVRSFKTRIYNVTITGNTGAGIRVAHAIDTYIYGGSVYGANNNITNQNVVIDTGASGVYIEALAVGYGLNGLIVQKSLNDGGAPAAYNSAPLFLFFDQFLADTTTGGDSCKFDSTLGSSSISAIFTNSWCSSAGMNNVPAVVTAAAVGLGLYGGTGITFDSGRIRFNAASGVLVNNANVNQWRISNSTVTANNQSNTANLSGIDVTSASPNGSIINNTIGNVLDAGGNQKFGVRVTAVNADVLRIEDNDLSNNVTSAISNSNTGNTWVWGNAPMAGPTGNVVWGNILMTNTLQMNNFAITGINGITPNTAGSDFGTTALPFGNLWVGTAATNNFKFQPAATAAARVITIADPLGATNLVLTPAAGTIRNSLHIADQGTACANGNLALSAGWGTTAAATNARGQGQTCEWTITASGTGQAASPTITWTVPTVLPSASVLCEGSVKGGTQATPSTIDHTTLSATAPIFTYNGTPTAAATLFVLLRCGP